MAIIFSEDFEAAALGPEQPSLGAFTFVSGATESFSDDAGDFLTVTDGTAAIGSFVEYLGATGRFLAGMDLDGEGATLPIVVEVSGIDIAGLSGLSLSLDAAEDDNDASQNWDIADSVRVAARIDGGAFTDLINFESIPDGDDFNAEPGRDADFDGDGDAGAALTDSFQTFTSPIAGTGSTLDLRITLSLDSGDEDIALDNIRLQDGRILLNEVLGSTSGSDAEFIELFGPAGVSLDGLSLIVVESDQGAQAGTIDQRLDFGPGDAIGANGFFLAASEEAENVFSVSGDIALPNNFVENSAYTLALVETASLTGGTVAGTETVLDAVGVVAPSNPGDFSFGAPAVGPDGDFLPAGVGRVADGVDTDAAADWRILDAFNPPGDATPTPGGGSGEVEVTDRLIHEIQGATDLAGATLVGVPGAADESPLLGTGARVQGIVTQVLPDLGGFYMQEEDADADGDAATSEGIFVEAGDSVAAGDLVTVEGIVAETEGETRLEASSVTVDSTGIPLPAPVGISFPTATVLQDADGDFVANLEAYEGMRVTVPEPMAVTELFQLDRFGTIRVSSEGRLEQFTQNNLPDVAGFEQHLKDIAARSLVIDDGEDGQNPTPIRVPGLGADGTLDAGDVFRMGDEFIGLTGVLGFSEDDTGSEEPEYRLHRPDATLSQQNPRPAAPEDVASDFTVATFNVLNFFTTLDTFPDDEGVGPNGEGPRGADTNPQAAVPGVGPTDEYDRQLAKLVEAIYAIDADVVGLVEIENDFLAGGDSPDLPDAQAPRGIAAQALVDALNAAGDDGPYDWVDPGTEFVGDDVIATGFIYDTTTTRLAPGTTVEILDDSDLGTPGIPVFPNAVFNGQSSNRAALAASFEEIGSGEVFTAAVNHFKSKGSVNPAPGNAATGDGQANNNAIRLQAAEALEAWLATDPTGSGDPDALILGDLNAYAQEDPIRFLEDAGYTDLVRTFAGSDAASFVFDGQTGTLDYALADADLFSQVTGATEWQINSPEADAFDYNLDFGRDPALFTGTDPFRSSDHDPIVIGLDLGTQAPALPTGVVRGGPGDDVLAISANAAYVPGGGDDTALISRAVAPNAISLIEEPGQLRVQLVDGLQIVSSRVASGSIELVLDNGGVVRIGEADDDLFEIGANATTGETGITRNFDSFLSTTLGIEVDQNGDGFGGAVVIGGEDALV